MADRVGPHFNAVSTAYKLSQIAAVEKLLSLLPVGAQVLDAGCGTVMPTCAQLCAAGMSVTGIDVSEVMLAAARVNVPQAHFVRADLLSERVSALGMFDTVVSFFCLTRRGRER